MTTSDGRFKDMREGEVALDTPLGADATLAYIGRIETPWHARVDCPRQGDAAAGPLCRIHVMPIWIPALEGIDACAELQVLYWMHEARRDLVRLVPRSGAQRGPVCPARADPPQSNRLIDRCPGRARRPVLTVRGLDCLDGTPLLDLKAWRGVGR